MYENQRNENVNDNYAVSEARARIIKGTYMSSAPFQDLKLCRIADLTISEPATGSYLIVRTTEIPTLSSVIKTVVEDHTGETSTFRVHNLFDPDLEVNSNDIFPLGTVFILKEPLLVLDSNKRFVIRCDNPTDMIVLSKHHRLYHLTRNITWKRLDNEIPTEGTECMSCADWKELGNERFTKGLFNKALEAYFMSLKNSDETDNQLKNVLCCNISAAYLKLERFEQALEYARNVLDLDSKNVKALYRAGRSYYELRQYESAKACYENALKISPQAKDFQKEYSRCICRLEEKQGKIDIYKLFLTATLKPKTKIECADYNGPLKVVPILGKGRGVIATEDVVPGTLLCVSKAIQASFSKADSDQFSRTSDPTITVDHHENAKLVTKVFHTVLKNPNVFGATVYDLASNDNTVAHISFDDLATEPQIDIQRIRNIVNTNCYSIDAANVQERALISITMDYGSGLFVMPAYMNHSCLFNASWQTYNDLMVVFAVKFIHRGEEINLSYFNNLKPFREREEICSKRMFRCTCLLCEQDREGSSRELHERFDLLRKLEMLSQKILICSETREVLSQVEQVLCDMEKTYISKSSTLKPGLLMPYMKLALSMLQKRHIQDMLRYLDKALSSIGLSQNELLRYAEVGEPLPKNSLITPMIFHVIVMAICAHSYFGTKRQARRWFDALLSFEKMYTGGNVYMIKSKYKNLPAHFFT